MAEERNVFDQLAKNEMRTYQQIRKIVTGQGDDYITNCVLDFPYFKNNYKMIGIDLSKQQAFDVNLKAI